VKHDFSFSSKVKNLPCNEVDHWRLAGVGLLQNISKVFRR